MITAAGVNLQREVLIFNIYSHLEGGKLALPQTEIRNVIQVSVSGNKHLRTDDSTNDEEVGGLSETQLMQLASDQSYQLGVVSKQKDGLPDQVEIEGNTNLRRLKLARPPVTTSHFIFSLFMHEPHFIVSCRKLKM